MSPLPEEIRNLHGIVVSLNLGEFQGARTFMIADGYLRFEFNASDPVKDLGEAVRGLWTSYAILSMMDKYVKSGNDLVEAFDLVSKQIARALDGKVEFRPEGNTPSPGG